MHLKTNDGEQSLSIVNCMTLSSCKLECNDCRVLVSNFSEDQLNRYEMYRRAAFPKAAVKRVSFENSYFFSISSYFHEN